jgi:hypothetical protein
MRCLDVSRKKIANSFIQYQHKEANGKYYATFCPSDRKHGGKDVYLGTVVDKEKGIFYNRNSGYFRFTVEDGRTKLEPGEIVYLLLAGDEKNDRLPPKPALTLDFGDCWLLEHFLMASGLKSVFREAYPQDMETLLSLMAFKVLDSAANCYAQRWHEGSYARLLYPKAKLQSQRISEFLESLGNEQNVRRFFTAYLSYLKALPDSSENILIDSTGLPNDIQFSYTAVNNHNGVISDEARLIFVVDRNSGYPVYFRCVAGNIVDVTTLKTTINELKAQGMDVKHGILDAGYYSEGNIRAMFGEKIPFMLRLPTNRKLYKTLRQEHASEIKTPQYALKYRNRLIFMKRIEVQLFGYKGYAYIAVDFDRKVEEQRKYISSALEDGTIDQCTEEKLDSFGLFVLISSEAIETKDILPLYYTRQTIEQVFDFAKNDADLLPLRTHNEETFRGHILLAFMATVLIITVNKRMQGTKYCAKSAFHAFRRIKCNIYAQIVVTSEPGKDANAILKHLKLRIPETLDL